MNKKLISAAMAGLLMMTGCSGTNATSKSASQSGEKTTVEFWYAGGKTAVGVIQDIVDKYNESQDKYEVKQLRRLIMMKHIKSFRLQLRVIQRQIWCY